VSIQRSGLLKPEFERRKNNGKSKGKVHVGKSKSSDQKIRELKENIYGGGGGVDSSTQIHEVTGEVDEAYCRVRTLKTKGNGNFGLIEGRYWKSIFDNGEYQSRDNDREDRYMRC